MEFGRTIVEHDWHLQHGDRWTRRLLQTTGSEQQAGVGYDALNFNGDGIENTACGSEALEGNTSGNFNTADRNFQALQGNTTGGTNTAVGNLRTSANPCRYQQHCRRLWRWGTHQRR